ncbi:MAG: MerR family transcriptional regulator [Magnetospirillum sp.]|nr:MerR family transcriptional regulator [Magnetospirillum sp.]
MAADGELPLVRRTGKSEAAFRTISEVAEDLDVPQHVLRFWESKFPQVRPLKRGGGRRYYRPEDVAVLRRIRQLLYSEGYTIKGVQKLLRDGTSARHGEDEAQVPAAAPAPAESGAPADDGRGIGADVRRELEAIADELEQLRFLLDNRGP